eukprot:TRINITY_DN11821_c4_g1_i1.p1 TRINITY_DN11821_c4_g1~~TRINITY_DN11821_c4_g1_i1.p1  ORF type:complete len:232 (-),score=-12.88 TRINITY_DN11821_c4_g1_i1:72-698(-)
MWAFLSIENSMLGNYEDKGPFFSIIKKLLLKNLTQKYTVQEFLKAQKNQKNSFIFGINNSFSIIKNILFKISYRHERIKRILFGINNSFFYLKQAIPCLTILTQKKNNFQNLSFYKHLDFCGFASFFEIVFLNNSLKFLRHLKNLLRNFSLKNFQHRQILKRINKYQKELQQMLEDYNLPSEYDGNSLFECTYLQKHFMLYLSQHTFI